MYAGSLTSQYCVLGVYACWIMEATSNGLPVAPGEALEEDAIFDAIVQL